MLKHSFHVRVANEYDVHAVMQITKEAFQQYIKLAELPDIEALQETEEDVLNDIKNKIVLLATINEVPVGSIRLDINEEDHTAYLSRFGVSINNQNNGIGKVLMNVTDKIMREHRVEHLYLNTCAKVFDLIRFYYSRHFYIDSTSKDKGYIRAKLIKDYFYED